MDRLKNLKLKQETEGLRNCKDNAIMMGERMIKTQAEKQWIITNSKWSEADQEIAIKGGPEMEKLLNDRLFSIQAGTDKIESEVADIDQYMLLTNYIDKYQEKLGLYGTKSKQSEVDKVLAFTHQDLAKKANEVYLDFASFRQAKIKLETYSSVPS